MYVYVAHIMTTDIILTNSNRLIVRIPKEVQDKFKLKCHANYKSMSTVLRELIIEYIKKE